MNNEIQDKYWNESNLGLTQVKRQHYVSKAFLNIFSVDEKIHVYDLDEAKDFITSIRNVAVESHFYDINMADVHLSTENWLAQLEGNAFPVIDKLIKEPNNITSLSMEEEFFLARFIVAFRFRTPAFRYQSDNLHETLIQKFKEMGKQQIYHQYNKKEADRIWREINKKPDHWWLNESKPTHPADISTFMLSEVQGFANLLRAAPWRVGFVPVSEHLYTSDNPVSSYMRAVHPWWETAAFSSLIYFMPLSPKILLKIDRRPDQEKDEKIEPRGIRIHKDFSAWESSFSQCVVTSEALRFLYGEGPIIPRDCAIGNLTRIGKAQLDIAVSLGFDPRPPKLSL